MVQAHRLFLTIALLAGGLLGCSSVSPSPEQVERDVGEADEVMVHAGEQ